jgi:Ner family transcriptional regulator
MSQPWSPAKILAAVREKGGTYAGIARAYGIKDPAAPCKATKFPLYAGEQAIANFLGVPAKTIWPDRYDENGVPLHPRIRRIILNNHMTLNPRQNSEAL